MTTARREGEPLRLLQVVLSLDPGGTERLVIDMSRRLRDRASIAVCCLDAAGDWASQLSDLGIDVSALHRRPGFHPSLARRLARIVRRHRSDVVHCHHYSPFVYGALARLTTPGVRLVYTEHGRLSDAPPSAKRKVANLLLARVPARFAAVSADLRLHMIEAGFPARRVGVVHNGIDPGMAPTVADRAAARGELGLGEAEVVIGTIARLDPVKDLHTLVTAFEAVRRDRPDAKLVVIGDGPERAALAERLPDGLATAVLFAGQRDDARALLPAFDVYANSSLTEGISVTILEAMAAGLPVVATRVGGNAEVVLDGSTGRLVPAREPARLADALAALLREPATRSTYGAAGRRRVESDFSVDTMVARYLELYGAA